VRKNIVGLLLLIVFCISGSGFRARGGVMRVDEGLFKAESEHFVCIVEESLLDELPGFMKDCEDAYRVLTPLFRWEPKRKTVALYSDAVDMHNGWTLVSPRPTMLVYAADSPKSSTIYEPGSYRRRTVFHEFAHVLGMDARHGFHNAWTSLLGRVAPGDNDVLSFLLFLFTTSPGEMAPRWYQEGLAIWAETEFVGPGRGRNSVADMIFRMAYVDNRMLKGNQWDISLPEWPYGNAAYLYGMKVMEHSHLKYGVEDGSNRSIPAALSDDVSQGLNCFFNRRARGATGRSFRQLAADAMVRERQRQKDRVAALRSVPLTETPRLTPKRLGVSRPVFGADGTVYFVGAREADRTQIMAYDPRTGRTGEFGARATGGFSELAMGPRGRYLYYTRLNGVGVHQWRSQLCRHDLADGSTDMYSRQGRYLYPDISPDGKWLAAVRQAAGRQVLLEVPLLSAGDPSSERILARAPRGTSMIDPAYTPDGRHVVYVLADERESQMRRVTRDDLQERQLLSRPGVIVGPVFSADGRLFFSSDQSGVYNLYVADKEGNAPVMVTHVLGGLFDPAVSADGKHLAAAAYDSYGFYLTILSADSLKPVRASPPRLLPTWKPLPANKDRAEAAEAPETPAPDMVEAGPYRSLGNMAFEYWTPWARVEEGGAALGLALSFSDLAFNQQLLVEAGTETEFGEPLARLSYSYSGSRTALDLYAVRSRMTYYDLLQDRNDYFFDYDESLLRTGGYLSFPVTRADWQTQFSLGYQYADREGIEESIEDWAGRELVSTNLYEGGEGALWANWSFINGAVFPRSHSVEDGRAVSATLEWANGGLGGDLSRTRFRGDWIEYVTLPWGENHVLRLQGVYGAGSGDEVAQGAFGVGGYGWLVDASTPGLDPSIILRGYGANYQVGSQAVKASAAYRFPIHNIYRGMGTTAPFYLRQVFGEIFYEGGKAWGLESAGQPENEWLSSAGVELNMAMTVLRVLTFAPGMGIAVVPEREERERAGDDTDDETVQFYFAIKAGVNY
jgi:hypothetical protein